MYQALTFLHSLTRWLVLLSLAWSISVALPGWHFKSTFSRMANALRHWTATIAHIQLMIGILLYTRSPIVSYFWKNFSTASKSLDTLFFGMIHIALMITAITLITIGSAITKRKQTDEAKFKAMFGWYLVAFIIILIAIPWPFSPLASRPYFR